MAEVRVEAVGKVYAGNVEAIRDVSIHVPDGQMCVLVGPSGCGKSTLLRMIAGLETVTSGTIRIGSRVVNDEEPMDRDIAMVFQNYALYPHMSVYQNMAYGLKIRGTPKAEIEARVAEAARILEIEPFLQRRPRQLSGGQRQRVAMGRAIVRKPQVFLFDEPLSNLDAKLRVQMRVEIKRLQRALATTSVYVTHDQLEAMTLADVLVVMSKGRVEQIGSPLALYERPETVFVAGFIGAPPMNLLDLAAHPGPLGSVIKALGTRLPLTAALLGIRPEHLAIVTNAGVPDGAVTLDVDVAAVEAVGPETFLYGRVADGGPDVVLREQGKVEVAPGTRRRVYAKASDLHLFDKSAGKRLG